MFFMSVSVRLLKFLENFYAKVLLFSFACPKRIKEAKSTIFTFASIKVKATFLSKTNN